jgi:hypothetical protein
MSRCSAAIGLGRARQVAGAEIRSYVTMRTITPLALAAAMLSLATTARASLVANANFAIASGSTAPDASKLFYLSPTQQILGGWSVTKGTVDIVPATYWSKYGTVPEGADNSIDLVGTPNKVSPAPTSFGELQQAVETALETKYNLSFSYAFNPESFWNGIDESHFTKKLTVEVLGAENSVLATTTLTSSSVLRGTDNKPIMIWKTSDPLYFTADSTLTKIVFRGDVLNGQTSLVPGNIFAGPVIANVSLDEYVDNPPSGTEVPEPASVAVLAVGSLLLLSRRRG